MDSSQLYEKASQNVKDKLAQEGFGAQEMKTLVANIEALDHNSFKIFIDLFCTTQTPWLRAFLSIFVDGGTAHNFSLCFPGYRELDAVLNKLLTAVEILGQRLDPCDVTPSKHKSSTSSAANARYTLDQVQFTKADPDLDPFLDMIILLDRGFFWHDSILQYASLEGDVSTYCILNIIQPVVIVMNRFLNTWYDKQNSTQRRLFVSVRSQMRFGPKGGRAYVDHALVLRFPKPASPSQIAGVPLVLFEEKVVKSMRDWGMLYDRPPMVLKMDGPLDEEAKMVPQIRKYIFDSKVPYAMESDGLSHVGMIWDGCRGWLSEGNGIVGDYGYASYRSRALHKCKVIIPHNDPSTGKPAPRMVLAYLCFLSLQDRGLLT